MRTTALHPGPSPRWLCLHLADETYPTRSACGVRLGPRGEGEDRLGDVPSCAACQGIAARSPRPRKRAAKGRISNG